jgi:hypothetical protein
MVEYALILVLIAVVVVVILTVVGNQVNNAFSKRQQRAGHIAGSRPPAERGQAPDVQTEARPPG